MKLVRSPAGTISVAVADGILRAPGLRYGRAARGAAPVPATPDNAAMKPAPASPQLPIARLDQAIPGLFRDLGQSEDCLRLTVTAPEEARGAPVMVWLHGGSYEAAAGDLAVFDPSALVREQGVVVVAVTYRLGLLGWLGGGARPANLGAMDVLLALRWIRDNITTLGGDPERVTLFGQSSGGDLIARLIGAPEAEGLFAAAIIQSAPLSLLDRAGPMRRRMRLIAGPNIEGRSVEDLLRLQARIRRAVWRFGLAGQMPFGPEYGAHPFPTLAAQAAQQRRVAPKLRLMIGQTHDEAALFLPPPQTALARLGEVPRRAGVRALTRRIYERPAQVFAARHAGAGGEVGRYRFDWGKGAMGAAHLSDLPLLFPSLAWCGTPLVPAGMSVDSLLAEGREMRRLWADFARGKMPESGISGVLSLL